MHFRSLLLLASALLCGNRSEARVPQTTCNAWQAGFGVPGPDQPFEDFVTFDDGSGPALYGCGTFRSIGNEALRGVVRWNGAQWTQVGTGLSDVTALTVFDYGAGPKLVAGGRFTVADGAPANAIALWNGATWTPLAGSGPSGTENEILALSSFDDGSGPALFVGGSVQLGGSGPQRTIVRWQGGAWSDVSSGITLLQRPGSFAVFDAGSGPRLYVANRFGGVAPLLFVWNGTSFLGATSVFPQATVFDLETVTIGGSTALYLTGTFGFNGANPLNSIARFDGTNLTPLGLGIQYGSPGFERGEVLVEHDDGSGTRLVVGGSFATAGGVDAKGLASWNGNAWSRVAVPLGTVLDPALTALASFDDGAGRALFASGWFALAGRTPATHAAVLRPAGWTSFASGESVSGVVTALRSLRFQGATSLYASGGFQSAGATIAQGVARREEGTWTPLGDSSGMLGVVRDMVAADLGGGERIYATGGFSRIGGVYAQHVAQWDGHTWSPVGAGLNNGGRAIAVFDDGTGPAVYVAGVFTNVGVQANRIARWDGTSWSALGSGLSGGQDPAVVSLAVHDDGSGAALYASGRFRLAGGLNARGVARWDGTSWNPIGLASFGDVSQGEKKHLTVYDDGQGAKLYMSGLTHLVNPAVSTTVARWDGIAWTSTNPPTASIPGDLEVFHDASGPKLLAIDGGGPFTIVRTFDGAQWSTLPGNLDGPVTTSAELDGDHDGVPELFVGGTLRAADGIPSVNIAHFASCPTAATVVCAGDGTATACPCGNSGATGHGCASSVHATGAVLSSGGLASLSADTLVLAAEAVTGSSAIYAQGTSVAGGSGVPFDDGLRCTGGTVTRIGMAPIAGGASSFPQAGGLRLSQLGLVTAPGQVRVYQAVYRNAASFCTSGSSNATNGLTVTWSL